MGLFLASYIWGRWRRSSRRVGEPRQGRRRRRRKLGEQPRVSRVSICFPCVFPLFRASSTFPFGIPIGRWQRHVVPCVWNRAICDKFETHSRRQPDLVSSMLGKNRHPEFVRPSVLHYDLENRKNTLCFVILCKIIFIHTRRVLCSFLLNYPFIKFIRFIKLN